MPEFPALGYQSLKGTFGPGSPGSSCVADFLLVTAGAFVAGGTWPSANRAIYIPVSVHEWTTVYQLSIQVVTQNGNLDAGIYDEAGNRIVSMGSTAVGAAGIQLLNIADTVLAPGGYYLALCFDGTTASVFRRSDVAPFWETLGVKQQDLGSVTLPATATFAAPAAAYLPQINAHLNATI